MTTNSSTVTRDQNPNRATQSKSSGKHRLKRAGDYAKLLSAAAQRPTNAVDRTADGLSKERIAAAIDAMGRLQESYDQMGERLSAMHTNLASYLSEEGTISGESYAAQTDVAVDKKLLSPQKITTLLLFLLSEVEEKQANHGGLFDMILSLDNELLNEHFVPILDAVFEKAELSDKASKLYMESPKKQVKVVPLRKAS